MIHNQFNTIFDKIRSKGDPLCPPMLSPSSSKNINSKDNNQNVTSNRKNKTRRDLNFKGNFVFNKNNHRRAKSTRNSNKF